MELISFMLLLAVPVLFITIGKFGRSNVMSAIGGLLIVLLSINMMAGDGSGLSYTTGRYTTFAYTTFATNETMAMNSTETVTQTDVFGNGYVSSQLFGLSLTLVGMYIFLASVFSMLNMDVKLPW